MRAVPHSFIVGVAAASQLTGVALAQGLDARLAQRIIEACQAHAIPKGQSHAIAVVDAGGHPVAALRMDGNGPGPMAFSLEKAKAAALWGFSTAGMTEGAKATPGFANAPGVVTVAGGVPIYAADGRTLLGGVGASGEAPMDDASCAEAGIAAAGLKSRKG